MRFRLGKCVAILGGAVGILLFCSCEEHHVGEMPEVQREHVELATGSEEVPAAHSENSPSPTPPAKPTPVEFFPGSPDH